ncbi:MAG: fimbrillin family protein [Bacteroidales bacterium]|jgi:hypothetical protein|nr:fimbrillin family protein [Bacteroidales bacterium]
MRKTLLIVLAAAATLVACQKQAAPTMDQGPREVSFSMNNLNVYEFKSVAIGEENCDNVAIYASDLGANHVEYAVGQSNTLTPVSTTIYWGLGQTASTTFCARYPYVAANASGEYDIPADQTNEDAFTYQNNIVTAVATASPSTVGGVVFNFKHPFAKVVINVTNQLGGDGIASVKLTGMKCKASTFNVAEESPVTALSAEAEDTKDMLAYNSAEGVYQLIVMPQAAQPNIVVTTTLGSVYTFSLTASYTFTAGKVATAAVTLAPIGGSGGGGDLQSVSMSYSTTDWGNAASNPVNSSTSQTLGNYWHVVGCVYDDDHKSLGSYPAWNYDYPMALLQNGSWTIDINYDEAMSDTGKGLKLRRFTNGVTGDDRWATQFGFQTSTADDWTLTSEDTYQNLSSEQSSKNIRLASKGQWRLVLTDDDLTATRLGDVTSATTE